MDGVDRQVQTAAKPSPLPRRATPIGSGLRLAWGPNFDREAAARHGMSDLDCVSAVFITNACRFGNSVQQASRALDIAGHHGLRSVYLPQFWWLKEGVHELPGGLRLVNRRGVLFDDEEVVVMGEFFKTAGLHGLQGGGKSHHAMIKLIRPLIMLAPSGPPLQEDHLVIHVRAGDVFSGHWVHPGYGQAPLGFYQRVLESQHWSGVTLIAEDGRNPVWPALIALCERNHGVEIRLGQPLAEDLAYMLRARCLVAARGTFGNAIAALSSHLKTVHFFESAFNRWGNTGVRAIRWIDTSGKYRQEILSHNWKNRPGQRRLMNEYPAVHITACHR